MLRMQVQLLYLILKPVFRKIINVQDHAIDVAYLGMPHLQCNTYPIPTHDRTFFHGRLFNDHMQLDHYLLPKK